MKTPPIHWPFTGSAYEPSLGLKPLLVSEWLEYGPDRDHQLSLKRRLLLEQRDVVLQVLPSAVGACIELRELIEEHLRQTIPGFTPYAMDNEPLAQLSLWTQEDWAILSSEAPVRLEAGCICFPSRWSLKEKIGGTSAMIHGPVPRFSQIAKPTESFLERITPERPVWRLNWTIHDSAELHTPVAHPSRSHLTPETVLENSFLRLEKQTLRRLPKTRAVAFSIRTSIHRLSDVTADPNRRREMGSTLASLDEATIRYKGFANFYEALVSALHSS